MNLLEVLKKEKDKAEIIKIVKEKNIKYNKAFLMYYNTEIIEAVFKTVKYYNLKRVSYLNYDEYRLYKIPFQTGQKRISEYTKYIEIDGKQYNKITKQERTLKSIEHSEYTSLKRTKQKIYEYALSNDWTNGFFFTITFNPELTDSFNYDECYNRIYQFLKNVKRQNPEFKYIFVPELHKSGRIHFHGIGTHCKKLKLIDSGKLKKKKKIFNINSRSFKYGFTTVTKIEEPHKICSYITKYITKELITATKGKHRYLFSKNLDKPTVENIMLEDKELFLRSVKLNPNVYYEKDYINEKTEQEIKYIHVKK